LTKVLVEESLRLLQVNYDHLVSMNKIFHQSMYITLSNFF
jgi:hypothetical protein